MGAGNWTRRLDFLDQVHLGAVGRFEKADAAAIVGRHLFEDAHAIFAHAGQGPVIVFGVDRDVLDAVMLLVFLSGDQAGDVELQPVQIEAEAAAWDLGIESTFNQ